jgi:hypothetical protein
MKISLSYAVFWFQKILLSSSYYFFKMMGNQRGIAWVVGVDEIATNIKYISEALPDSYSISLSKNRFYDFEYDYSLKSKGNFKINLIKRSIVGPILLGFLLNNAKGFFYIFSTGFLLSNIDGRDYEFAYIKNKNKKLICWFVGNDIRSPKKMIEFSKSSKNEVTANYYFLTSPERLSDEYENSKKLIASATDRHADLVFNYEFDQMSYLKRGVLPVYYLYPDSNFHKNNNKFINQSNVIIVHAPSSPIIKGTQLVRAAIKKLKVEGYKFKYVEFIESTNVDILEQLKDANIVLNEFYSFAPGVFGVEAMASHCALLTSADEEIELSLPVGSNKAWMVTRNYEIYDNLKVLLDSPLLVKKYADSGYEWALEHAAISSTGKKLENILNKL